MSPRQAQKPRATPGAALALGSCLSLAACGDDAALDGRGDAEGGSGPTGGAAAMQGGGPAEPPLAMGGNVVDVPVAGGGGGPSEPGCAHAEVTFERQLPNVLLVVDRSRSMYTPDFGSEERWDAVSQALVDPMRGIVTERESDVRFALTFYTGPPDTGEPMPGASCPLLTEDLALPALGRRADIQSAFRNAFRDSLENGSTPTGASLGVLWPKFMALDAESYPGRRVMVLATDGEPNTCDGATEDQIPPGREASLAAVEEAFAAGLPTYVIGVGGEVAADHLNQVANVGQGFDAGDPTVRAYRTFNTNDLASAFGTIVNGVRDCVFELNGTVTPGSADLGIVLLDGTALAYQDPDGWRLTAPNQVTVDGAACETIKTSASVSTLSIDFPCEIFEPE